MHNSQHLTLFNRVHKSRRLISLTPLIDVVFILLVFFMLASSYEKWHSLPLDSARKGAGQASAQSVLIRLKQDSLDLNGKPISLSQLRRFIGDKISKMPDLQVLIQTDGPIVIQQTVNVVDELHAAGVKKVSLLQK